MSARNAATERQVQAARPDASTWLAANAGSGKTRVLTDRVARLLLNRVQPQHILCLTYTKAAASEMQNRLFRRLGSWAMQGDAELGQSLAALGVDNAVSPQRLAQARTLFARALETPGGLKIQTIHSFCASLLRRFPLEAGVSPQFSEIEDRAAALLRAAIVEDFADGPQSGLIDGLAQYVTGADFDDLTAALVRKQGAFAEVLNWPGLLQVFGLPAGFDEAELQARVFLGGEASLLARLVPVLAAGKSTDIKAAQTLSRVGAPDLSNLAVLEKLFLTGTGAKQPFSAKSDSFPTKDLRLANAGLMAELGAFMQRVEAGRPLRLALAAARKSLALHNFAGAFLAEYARRKQLRGWLDFDDLILKARQLLNDRAVAAWVLYRLDGGIDHILVDEAQDTSPAQWEVIEKLAQEFTSGLGARSDVERTVFVVGDKKQSIYSFQGADPDAFDRMQAEFGNRLRDAGNRLENLTLEFSFRSSDVILRLVDQVFSGQQAAGFRKDSQHRTFKSDLPGRVDLWPVVQKIDDKDDRVWTDPVDRTGQRHHTVILAERIARRIRHMIDGGETIPIDGATAGSFLRRPVHAGDFLILVQRRSDLFAEIIRACKAAGLPIAGADRLKVGAELAVKDLAALLTFLSTPEDSLSLAIVLKSPLLGWTEQMLFDLAHRRDGPYLWQALRDRGGEFPETLAVLHDLRDQTDFLRPYDLIERILTRHDGRRRLLARLGPEAEDGINALLAQALAYERNDIPSLTGFLAWMQTDDLEIKRQVGSSGHLIRVMTVHGAKGLESPIVILPDTGPRRAPGDDGIMMAADVPLWKTAADQMPDVLLTARDAARGKQINERLRLLYVALTRAEKWLIVAVAGDLDKNGDSWYQMVQAAMQDLNAQGLAMEAETGLRLEHENWTAPPQITAPQTSGQAVRLPGYFSVPAGDTAPPPAPLNPSDLGGAKALPGNGGLDEAAAMARGTHLHLLLEHLPGQPQPDWPAMADHLLAQTAKPERAELLAEARAVLTDPALAHVFGRETLAEVGVAARIGARRMHGVIDRLIVSDSTVQAIDFKTNATVPDRAESCPEGLLRQMGAYAQALRQIYPKHRIETYILWTRTAAIVYLPHDLVTEALNRAACLDGGGAHS
jgi:ATP-dependent helicase/nuclease subunit A